MPARIGIAVAVLLALGAGPAAAACGAHACKCARAFRTVEKLICEDKSLSAVDIRLERIYAAASARAAKDPNSRLAVDQRKWENSLNGCWKSPDVKACIVRAYETRLAELTSGHEVAKTTSSPSTYACEGQRDLVVTYFPTTPPSAQVERADQKKAMLVATADSAGRYSDGNVTFWEKDGEAHVTWDGQEGSCSRKVAPVANAAPSAVTAQAPAAAPGSTDATAQPATAPAPAPAQ